MNFPQTHNANQWTSIVLAAIVAITDNQPGREVRHRDIVSHLECDDAFPGWDHWGVSTIKGKPVAKGYRAVTLAAGKLKDEGRVTQPRRGYYCLAGYDHGPVPFTPTAAPVPFTPTAAPTVAPVAVPADVVAVAGVQVIPPAPQTIGGGYEADAGLRRMVVNQTRCFGAWSSRSDQCGKCPLAGLCQQAAISDFAEIAAVLDASTEAEIATNEAKLAKAVNDAKAAKAAAAVPKAAALDPDVKVVSTPFALNCTACGEVIPAGGDVAYIQDRGAIHPACV